MPDSTPPPLPDLVLAGFSFAHFHRYGFGCSAWTRSTFGGGLYLAGSGVSDSPCFRMDLALDLNIVSLAWVEIAEEF